MIHICNRHQKHRGSLSVWLARQAVDSPWESRCEDCVCGDFIPCDTSVQYAAYQSLIGVGIIRFRLFWWGWRFFFLFQVSFVFVFPPAGLDLGLANGRAVLGWCPGFRVRVGCWKDWVVYKWIGM